MRIDPIIIGIVIFFFVHFLIRIFATSDFSVDDTETVVHTQVLQPYYSLRNPPLFDWLFFGLSQLIGVSLVTIQILKTLILTSAGIFLFLAIKPAFRTRGALEAAIVSYGATAFYGWDVFQQFSHTIALIFSMAFTLWAFMRLFRYARTVDYVVLGLGLGLGLLSKYLFALYFVSLLVASLRQKKYRVAILSWRIGLTFVVALIVVSPLLIGLSDAISAMFSTVGGRVAGSKSWPDIESIAYLFLLTAEFWLPFLAILWLGFYRWPASDPANVQVDQQNSNGEGDESFYPLVRDATLFMAVAVLVAVIFLGTSISGGRYLVSILSLLPLTIFAAIDHWRPFPSVAVYQFWRGAMMFIVGLAVVRFAIFLFMAPPFCVPRCVLFVDYTPVAEKIGTADGKQDVILTNHVHIGSNLLRLVPNSRVVMDAYTGGSDLGIADPPDRNCYFVWFKEYLRPGETTFASALQHALRRPPLEAELAAVTSVEYVTAKWQTTLLDAWAPDTTIGIAKLDSETRICDGGRIPGLSAPPNNNTMR